MRAKQKTEWERLVLIDKLMTAESRKKPSVTSFTRERAHALSPVKADQTNLLVEWTVGVVKYCQILNRREESKLLANNKQQMSRKTHSFFEK